MASVPEQTDCGLLKPAYALTESEAFGPSIVFAFCDLHIGSGVSTGALNRFSGLHRQPIAYRRDQFGAKSLRAEDLPQDVSAHTVWQDKRLRARCLRIKCILFLEMKIFE
jgi:hypothetical protein